MTEFRARAHELVAQMTLAEKCAQMRYDAPAIDRLGVPAYNWWNEALHGVARSGVATVFPQAIGMAASFDDKLLERVATAVSDEARAKYNEYRRFGSALIYQGLTFWSPNINIFRDPRWGRGHETYGEDPYLTGRMGAAFVRGLQGYDRKYRKLDATLKHYAVHSGPEGLRHEFDACPTPRDMFDTYLRAFKYCIDHSDPDAVMGAYNRVNGEPACASPTLLQKILRERFGFRGYVVSDCGAIADIHKHHGVTKNAAESAALAVNHGCELNCGGAYAALTAAVAEGLVSEARITEAVEMLFEARFRLGMFDDDCQYDRIPYDVVDCSAHRALNLKMARESIVLLKNDGILPLKNDTRLKLAVIGPNADERALLLGNYFGTPSHQTTLLEGIQRAARGSIIYSPGCHHFMDEDNDPSHLRHMRDAVIAAQKSDVVIMCMGLYPAMEGEECEDVRALTDHGDKLTIELPHSQRVLYDAVRAVGKPIIFINCSGSALALGEQADDPLCRGMIQLFYCGAEGGTALADVLFGKVSPSGRLPLTFYRSDDDLPAFDDYSMAGRTYRYFTGKPVFPFGHGLSYTQFRYSAMAVEKTQRGVRVRVDVENIGGVRGGDAVLLYYTLKGAPEDAPVRQLCGMSRVDLFPGQKRTVRFVLPHEAIYYVDERGEDVLWDAAQTLFHCGELSAQAL